MQHKSNKVSEGKGRMSMELSQEMDQRRNKGIQLIFKHFLLLTNIVILLSLIISCDNDQTKGLNKNERIDYLKEEGKRYSELKNYKKAIDVFTKAIAIEPNDSHLYFSRGISYEAIKEFQKAINDYSKSIELGGPDEITYGSRGGAYHSLAEDSNDKNKSKDYYYKAIHDYTRAIQLIPGLAEHYIYRGICYADGLKDYHMAIVDLNNAINLKPPYYLKGITYFYRGVAIQKLYKENCSIYCRGDEDEKKCYKSCVNECYQHYNDFIVAAQEGFKPAQEYLKSVNIKW